MFIPTVNTYNNVTSTFETTTINGQSLANTLGTQETDVSIEGKIRLYGEDTATQQFPAGSLIFQEIKILDPDNGSTIVDYFAAKDKNNKACFWDILSDTLCYANSGDLVAIMD